MFQSKKNQISKCFRKKWFSDFLKAGIISLGFAGMKNGNLVHFSREGASAGGKWTR